MIEVSPLSPSNTHQVHRQNPSTRGFTPTSENPLLPAVFGSMAPSQAASPLRADAPAFQPDENAHDKKSTKGPAAQASLNSEGGTGPESGAVPGRPRPADQGAAARANNTFRTLAPPASLAMGAGMRRAAGADKPPTNHEAAASAGTAARASTLPATRTASWRTKKTTVSAAAPTPWDMSLPTQHSVAARAKEEKTTGLASKSHAPASPAATAFPAKEEAGKKKARTAALSITREPTTGARRASRAEAPPTKQGTASGTEDTTRAASPSLHETGPTTTTSRRDRAPSTKRDAMATAGRHACAEAPPAPQGPVTGAGHRQPNIYDVLSEGFYDENAGGTRCAAAAASAEGGELVLEGRARECTRAQRAGKPEDQIGPSLAAQTCLSADAAEYFPWQWVFARPSSGGARSTTAARAATGDESDKRRAAPGQVTPAELVTAAGTERTLRATAPPANKETERGVLHSARAETLPTNQESASGGTALRARAPTKQAALPGMESNTHAPASPATQSTEESTARAVTPPTTRKTATSCEYRARAATPQTAQRTASVTKNTTFATATAPSTKRGATAGAERQACTGEPPAPRGPVTGAAVPRADAIMTTRSQGRPNFYDVLNEEFSDEDAEGSAAAASAEGGELELEGRAQECTRAPRLAAAEAAPQKARASPQKERRSTSLSAEAEVYLPRQWVFAHPSPRRAGSSHDAKAVPGDPEPRLARPRMPPPRTPPFSVPNPKVVKHTSRSTTSVPGNLDEFIERDAALLAKLGWTAFVKSRRQRSDFATLDNVHHDAHRLLKFYKARGAPVKMSTPAWSAARVDEALERGPHKSCDDYHEFLGEEFADMINKGQWVVLPASAVENMPGLRISPPGVVPQRGRRPRWIVDYTFSDVNKETLPLAAMEAMQFGHALDRILREILLADPELGPVQLLKVDISDGFYRINLNIDDIPKLGVAFPTKPGEEKLVALPLVLPMGWKNSPPIFSAATETATDLTNDRLAARVPPAPHRLDEAAEKIPSPPPNRVALKSILKKPKERWIRYKHHNHPKVVRWRTKRVQRPRVGTAVPTTRDPCLPTRRRAAAYVDVFVDDFVALAQQHGNSRRVRRTLMHAIDDIFRPLDAFDDAFRREPVSMKKLLQGDCSWGTIKLILGWIIDTVNMTISLPPHRVERLAEILASIPIDQKRTSVRKWHKVLGELRSMSLALPGARHLFSHMQLALSKKIKSRVNLTKGVHDSLEDFRWLLADIKSRPTRIAELVPLLASAEGHHDASGKGAGGVWFPAKHLVPRRGYKNTPVLWRLEWPQNIIDDLVTSSNPNGSISNSDLELAGGLLHLEAIAQCFDTRERTLLSKTDNLNTLFWQRSASATTEKVPAHLLRLFGIHQRYHRYVPRHDYLAGPSNPVADATSRDFHLTWPELTTSLAPYLPKRASCQIWTPSDEIVSSVLSALQRKRLPPESLWVAPNPPRPYGTYGKGSVLNWASTPFSKPSKTKYQSYHSSHSEYVLANLQPGAIPSSLDRLKITYGTLHRRPRAWGPMTGESVCVSRRRFSA